MVAIIYSGQLASRDFASVPTRETRNRPALPTAQRSTELLITLELANAFSASNASSIQVVLLLLLWVDWVPAQLRAGVPGEISNWWKSSPLLRVRQGDNGVNSTPWHCMHPRTTRRQRCNSRALAWERTKGNPPPPRFALVWLWWYECEKRSWF